MDKKGYALTSTDVLLVEDNELDAKLFMMLLKDRLGLRAHHVGSVAEAFAWLEFHRPRLIHTDIMMPEVSGWEFLERLKADPATKDIPVIVATAGAIVHGAGLHPVVAKLAAVLFAKPISGDIYLEKVQSLLCSVVQPG